MKPVSPAAVLITVLVVGCLWAIPAAAQDTPASSAAAPPVDYLRDVRPILRAKCSMCHNEAEAGGGEAEAADGPPGSPPLAIGTRTQLPHSSHEPS